jgi:hypothetical protein
MERKEEEKEEKKKVHGILKHLILFFSVQRFSCTLFFKKKNHSAMRWFSLPSLLF